MKMQKKHIIVFATTNVSQMHSQYVAELAATAEELEEIVL